MQNRRILLIIGGGIAAYKSLELIRRLADRDIAVRAVLTAAGAQFITPLSVASLTGEKAYTELFSLTDEAEMGHIRLSREADLILVAPATADLLASMANGNARDLATTTLLATDKPVMVAPAMNVQMWANPATQRNVGTLAADGVLRVGPNQGDLACGEEGYGRMAEVEEIVAAVEDFYSGEANKPLAGRSALVTAGPTHEAIDPVRYISNYSSGKQGYAIAAALARLGADTTLISGPTDLADPLGVKIVRISSAQQMLEACEAALPVDAAICVAAVADWRVADEARNKIKKNGGGAPALDLVENPDILASIAGRRGNDRPGLVVGFAAETENVVEHAKTKREKKNCDWIVANDVAPGTDTMGGDDNEVHLVTPDGVEDWPKASKIDVAAQLADRIAMHFTDIAT